MARPEVTGKNPRVSSEVALPEQHARGPPLAMTVPQFCKAHGISIGHFYALLKRGLGPRVMKLGVRTLISTEEAARWRAERTAASNAA
jgi:predicted DNA-binding transcriptional regulator AlpA